MPSPVTRQKVWVNVSPAYKCWRLVYNSASRRAFLVFEKEGLTKTMQSLFCSTRTDGAPGSVSSAEGKRECLDRAERLGLFLSGKTIHDEL
jgi:hypothetical protein